MKPYPAWDTVEKLLHPIIDRDGLAKPVLQILAEDAIAAAVERIVLVVGPNDEVEYRRQLAQLTTTMASSPASRPAQRAQAAWLADLIPRLHFAVQDRPLGLGHALWCARSQVVGPRVLVMLSDHLPLSRAADGRGCAAQLVARAGSTAGPVSSVEPLPEHLIHRYGVVRGQPVAGARDAWSVDRVIEKPTPTQAELDLETHGLRRGEYLVFAGMHVLPTGLLDRIGERIAAGEANAGDLTPVLDRAAIEGDYLAVRLEGQHQDTGTAYGLLEAQLQRALLGPDRERVLVRLLDILGQDALRWGAGR